jgi:NADH-quinone oxidoreductase subunit I
VCGLPSNAIKEIVPSEGPEHEKYPTQFVIDLTRCIFCGFCQEACPKGAIKLNNLYELAQYQKNVLILEIDRATQAKSEMRMTDWL